MKQLLWLALVPCVSAAAQQQPSLRGTVVSAETREPLGLTIVTLHPQVGRQFTDPAGAFTFPNLRAGTYFLSVRQIGYVPLDTQIVLPSATSTTVLIMVQRLAIELPPVTITSEPCTRPGRPDSSDAALHAVFTQLAENARRLELLADSYPFHYRRESTERIVDQRGDSGRATGRTMRFSSNDYHAYAVGRVIEGGWGPWGSDVLVIHNAELRHFGNAQFIANHCFRLGGRDTLAGDTLIRIDFEPAAQLRSADMAGAAYLDPVSYQIRYTNTRITRLELSPLTDVRSWTFHTRFRDIAPGVPLEESELSVTTYRFRRSTRVVRSRVVDVRFRRRPP